MLKSIFRSTLPALILTALIGCTTTDSSTVSTQDFKNSLSAKDGSQLTPLVAGNTIEVSVEVDGRMEVSRHRAGLSYQGFATLPLVGDVKVGGLTLAQARKEIAKTYGAYYVSAPVIMVSMLSGSEEGEWGYITVMGRVRTPGTVPLRDADGMKLTQAIQSVGGFATSAKQNEIRVTRLDQSGKKLQVYVDFEAIGQTGSAESDINLIDGDIVYVPERIF
jgi:polysaccharide export outer membrane protein